MADGPNKPGETKAREAHSPAFSASRFEKSPEFAVFKAGISKILAVPKSRLDELVKKSKATSPRAGNPAAAGRKKKDLDG